MKYQLQDMDVELWAWVKAQATRRQITISQYIQLMLFEVRASVLDLERRKIIKEHSHKKGPRSARKGGNKC